jgi:competence protein ComEC
MIGGRKQSVLILGFLFLANLAAWQAVFYFHFSAEKLEAVFFNVGQGDAIFIKTPQGHQVLIDGGPDAAILEKLSREIPFWDRDLDMVILTHPDKDHLFGILEALKKYKVENIVWSGLAEENTAEFKEWQKFKAEESREGAKEVKVSAGQRIIAGSAAFSVLYPFSGQKKTKSEDNEDSLALRLDFKDNSFIFCGDIGFYEEQKITETSENVSAQVLKVAHHGSKYSTSQTFLDKVSPRFAIIQVGKNSYGHPAKEVLTRLQKSGINTLRTDVNGDIKVIADGEGIEVR